MEILLKNKDAVYNGNMGQNSVQRPNINKKSPLHAGVYPSPTESKDKFTKLLVEIKWFLSLAACVALLLILITYNQHDPAWSNNSGGEIKNLGGRAGAFVADLLLFVFGASAYWWVILFARRVTQGWTKIANPEWLQEEQEKSQAQDQKSNQEVLIVRWLGFLMTLISSVTLESIRLHTLKIPLPNDHPGGVLGEMIGDPLQDLLGFTGSTLFLLFVFFSGLSLFLHFSWLSFSEKVGRYLEIMFLSLRNKRQTVEDRKIGEVAAVEREEFVEEELEKYVEEEPIQIVRQSTTIEISDRVVREKQKNLFEEIPDSELPPLALLDEAPGRQEMISADTLEFTSRLIERKLKDFGVEVKVIAAYPGPVITRYEIEPAVGVKGSQIVNLSKDLNRALGTQALRVVETIAGKTCMGLEVPNPKRQMISLSEILSSQVYNGSPSLLTLALGKDIAGQPMVADLAKMPHCLVAGTTGSGKSVGINAMILSLLFKAKQDEVRLILIDPKMLEMAMYEDIPHLLTPVVTDMKQASNALQWAVKEMDRRYKLMSKFGVRNLAGFNKKIADAQAAGTHLFNPFSLTPEDPEPLQKAPTIVIIIDELADLMMVVGKKLEELIARIAQKARAAGIHLILATQRPSVDVITGLIKANVPTRLSFQVSSRIDSRTILDQQGAEALLGMGDMLFMPPGSGHPQRMHGAFVSDDEVQRVVNWLKERGTANYVDEIIDGSSDESAEGAGGEAGGESDPLYDQAVAIVLENKRASISLVQRHLRIGYNRAARLLEDMERAGLVSKMSGSGTREILAPRSEHL
ncbi:DNA translocase FtsK [Polynucleobacter kasalickyi]|uniref:DNA translocase FtsK n=2 Tax=Polynucleobacter kasalickyi TaxID=1938817 RepID=A0A1W1Y4W9_9BURK|nr:DNA translocase FtsK [Polynucleobacter kasalickyi]